MKKIFLSSFIFLLLIIINLNYCNAQPHHYSDTLKKNIIKLTPWGIYLGSYNIQYERLFNMNNSFEFLFNFKYNTRNNFLTYKNNFPDLTDLAVGYSFLIDYRHYSINCTKKGRTYYTYFAPFFKFTYLDFTATGTDYYYELKVKSYKVGIDWGFQKKYKNGFVFDIFGGPFLRFTKNIYGGNDYYNLPWENDKYTFYIGGIGIGIRAGLNIGYCF